MISTQKYLDLSTMTMKNKEFPDWYGIPNIGFIFVNTQSDPLIEYKGRRCSCFVVEDTMWENWIHDDNGNLLTDREKDFDGFDEYMLENKEKVYELCELALFPEQFE